MFGDARRYIGFNYPFGTWFYVNGQQDPTGVLQLSVIVQGQWESLCGIVFLYCMFYDMETSAVPSVRANGELNVFFSPLRLSLILRHPIHSMWTTLIDL